MEIAARPLGQDPVIEPEAPFADESWIPTAMPPDQRAQPLAAMGREFVRSGTAGRECEMRNHVPPVVMVLLHIPQVQHQFCTVSTGNRIGIGILEEMVAQTSHQVTYDARFCLHRSCRGSQAMISTPPRQCPTARRAERAEIYPSLSPRRENLAQREVESQVNSVRLLHLYAINPRCVA